MSNTHTSTLVAPSNLWCCDSTTSVSQPCIVTSSISLLECWQVATTRSSFVLQNEIHTYTSSSLRQIGRDFSYKPNDSRIECSICSANSERDISDSCFVFTCSAFWAYYQWCSVDFKTIQSECWVIKMCQLEKLTSLQSSVELSHHECFCKLPFLSLWLRQCAIYQSKCLSSLNVCRWYINLFHKRERVKLFGRRWYIMHYSP